MPTGSTLSNLPYVLAPGPLLPAARNPRWRRLGRSAIKFGLLGLILAVLIAWHRPLLAGFAGLFRVDDPVRSDALVVLLGESHRPRLAAGLYRRGLAPVLLVGTSVQDEDSPDRDETAFYRERLQANGVPASAIVVMPGEVSSTRDEAMRVRDYAKQHHLRRITVVTTAFHTARARWIFRKVLKGMGIDVHMAAADHPDLREDTWYRSDEGMVVYFSEAIKTLYYRLVY
jgi:uncharacterized SAM-binding protein YcdF (DUF218 family)